MNMPAEHKKIGEKVTKNEPLATLYTNDEALFQDAINSLSSAYQFTSTPPTPNPLIIETVRGESITFGLLII